MLKIFYHLIKKNQFKIKYLENIEVIFIFLDFLMQMKSFLIIKNSLLKFQSKHFHSSSTKFNLKYSYYSSKSEFPLSYATIGKTVEKAAELYGDRDAHVFQESNTRITFKELKEKAENIACGLLALGFKRGDRLGIWAPNCLEWILTQYSTALIGVIQVNINPAYKTHELEYSLKNVGCRGIVMYDKLKNQNYIEMMLDICPELATSKPGQLNSQRLPLLKNVISIGEKSHHGTIKFNHLEDFGDDKSRKVLNDLSTQVQPSDPINIQFTSGNLKFHFKN